MPPNDVLDAAADRGRPQAAAARFRPPARPGLGDLHRRHPRARGHAACRDRHGERGRGRAEEPRPFGGQGRARRRRGDHGGGHSGQERHRAGLRRRAAARRARGDVPRPGGVRRRRPHAATKPAARRASAKWRSRRRAPSVTVADALASGARVQDDYAFGRGDAKARDRRRAASARRPVRDRRPGAFLSRGPGLLRHSRRGRRDDGARLEPGPDRDAAHRRARPRRSRRLRHRRDAPHGRRLRRQGEPGLHLGGDGGARRARHRPAVQGPARSRRRFRADRQAPRFPRRLARSATTTRA